ncbi:MULTISPECIES: hypothetical protein [unclassified Sphingomonas]|uniref:hypothetical protein n=1 Tax=unclassified Sphingomonas TaxID=196159 RepID=UPI0021518E34|nr:MULTISPECIES: hypothetical protein [unclassified Sphingomonas]MCR5871713.1 hypothetical protein [Sphingomonas sp. J344]UUX99999.1 hypothetical protein LRS08_02320 [Sphingomonas sp. J315]
MEGDGTAERYAAMVVPQGLPEVVAGAKVANDAVAPVKAVVAERAAPAPVAVAAVAKPKRAAAPAPVVAKDAAVASLDSKLLKDSSFGDLMQGVRAEARKLR